MEKRNFVTPIRTKDDRDFGDSLVGAVSSMFGAPLPTCKCASDSKSDAFALKASKEDEKTDSLT